MIRHFMPTILATAFLMASVSGFASEQVMDPRTDSSPWGIASGAEWGEDYPRFNPLLRDAGITWLRYFPEWKTTQPAKGEWNWEMSDAMVANAKENGIHMTPFFGYAANWTTSDGTTRRMPLKDNQYWRDYVTAMVDRYKADIQYWEVWNEFNGSFATGENTPEVYAELVRDASEAAKKVDPTAKIGLSVANFSVGYIDATIKAGLKRRAPL